MQADDASFEEKVHRIMKSMRLIPKQGVDGQLRVNEGAQEATF